MTAFHRVHGRELGTPVDKGVDKWGVIHRAKMGLSTGSYIYIWNGDINGVMGYL